MTYDQFSESLREQGQYDTPTTARVAVTRVPGVASPWFYSAMLGEIVACSTSIVLGRFDLHRWGLASWRILRFLESAGGRFEVRGLHRLREVEGAAVVVSNHMSTMETMVFPSLILAFKPCAFIIKESLLKYPFFGRINANVDSIPVTRSNPRLDFERVMTDGSRLLNSGKSMIIFPQSTRSDVFDPAKFGTLASKLARKAQVPLVPVAVKTDMWGNGRYLKEFGPLDPAKTIQIEFGAPIEVTGNGREAHEQVTRYVIERLNRWGAAVAAPADAGDAAHS